MAQMRITLTSPYGVVSRDFPEYERDVATADGTVLITESVLLLLLNQAEQVSHDQQLEPLIGFDGYDEGDYAVAVGRTVLGRRTVTALLLRSQEGGMYELGEGIDMSEWHIYELDSLPFEVTVDDATGQLYDEVKAGEA